MDMLDAMHPTLTQLIAQSLHNIPDQRPTAEDLLVALQRMKEEVDGEYGGRAIKVDMEKVKLTREVKVKERRIKELEQQVSYTACGISGVLIHGFFVLVGAQDGWRNQSKNGGIPDWGACYWFSLNTVMISPNDVILAVNSVFPFCGPCIQYKDSYKRK